jgi:type IV secretion system protein VirD4
MMPQELIQMPSDKLLVLRAGIAPVRADKVVYWREKAFLRRVAPPPVVAAYPGPASTDTAYPPPSILTPSAKDGLTLELIIPTLDAAGLEPLPERGASDDEVEAWVERFIDASVRPIQQDADHAR